MYLLWLNTSVERMFHFTTELLEMWGSILTTICRGITNAVLGKAEGKKSCPVVIG